MLFPFSSANFDNSHTHRFDEMVNKSFVEILKATLQQTNTEQSHGIANGLPPFLKVKPCHAKGLTT